MLENNEFSEHSCEFCTWWIGEKDRNAFKKMKKIKVILHFYNASFYIKLLSSKFWHC